MIHEHLPVCGSTQDEVRTRLDSVAAGELVVVSTDSQQAGRGRDGRIWQDPPGTALMISVGRRGPLPTSVLDELPRRVADGLRALLGARVEWKAPNDLVDREGAKLAGILVDARTVGDEVLYVIVGVGINATGDAFTTRDGRAATTLEQLDIAPPPIEIVAAAIAAQLA